MTTEKADKSVESAPLLHPALRCCTKSAARSLQVAPGLVAVAIAAAVAKAILKSPSALAQGHGSIGPKDTGLGNLGNLDSTCAVQDPKLVLMAQADLFGPT